MTNDQHAQQEQEQRDRFAQAQASWQRSKDESPSNVWYR